LEAKILSSSVKAVTCCAQVRDKTRMLPQRVRRLALPPRPAQLRLLREPLPAAGQAAVVEIQTARQVMATAEFRPGRPAMLLLQDFLRTRDFGVIKSIADTLADEGCWKARLQETGARTRPIRGANHFMAGTREFGMLETLSDIPGR